MANCGASGTALDRVVSAATGGSTASKQAVASLVGHASISGSGAAMPAAAPTFLSTPNRVGSMTFPVEQRPAVLATSTIGVGFAPQQHQSASHAPGMMHHAPPHLQHNMALPPHLMHQQHMLMMQQQQHQMLIMQQQQQQMALMAQMQQSQSHENKQPLQNNLKQDDFYDAETQHMSNKQPESWHEGLEEEALELGHEGLVQGASIEELAAAWAQAEAEYEDAVNLGAVYQQQQDASELYPYDFETSVEDVVSSHPNQSDWMTRAQQAFDAGEVQAAIQFCETELQRNDEHNSQAWYLLGKCHAEQDEDSKAIACLERSVEMDPYYSPALLALGVSHVNELNHGRALLNLQNWMTHNPKYAGLDVTSVEHDVYGNVGSQQESAFEQAQRLLLRAMEHDPTDAQVHEALGVVYNVSRDYDAAISSFERALELSSPNESYSLWNKLGATLANANRSEEALPHYHSALKLRPKYARAWLNMAISHSNLKNYQEAARCYLQTLSLNPNARHVWSYLRIALTGAEKWDLVPLAAKQDLAAFADYYDFVQY